MLLQQVRFICQQTEDILIQIFLQDYQAEQLQVLYSSDSAGVVVITQSGFGGGHIFKTTNSGTVWSDISGKPSGFTGK